MERGVSSVNNSSSKIIYRSRLLSVRDTLQVFIALSYYGRSWSGRDSIAVGIKWRSDLFLIRLFVFNALAHSFSKFGVRRDCKIIIFNG